MDVSTVTAAAAAALDWLTVIVFAVTGALVASRKQMDIFGFCLLGLVTGIGGGTLRELLLGTYPIFWVVEPAYVVVCVAVSIIVFFTAHIPQSRYTLLLWLDAVGISLVCVTGANHSLEAGTAALVAVVMGAITATAGGMIRDVLGGDSPVVLRREIYVTATIAGATVFVLAHTLGLSKVPAMVAGGAVCFMIRGLAIIYRWSLPAYRARPGRDPGDLGY